MGDEKSKKNEKHQNDTPSGAADLDPAEKRLADESDESATIARINDESATIARRLMNGWGSNLHHAIATLDAAKLIVIEAARDLLRREEEKTRQLRIAVECVNTGTPRDRRADRLADDTAVMDFFKREPVQAVGSAYIAEQTGVSAEGLRKALQRLTKAGKLTCSGRGMGAKYALATSPASVPVESAAQ